MRAFAIIAVLIFGLTVAPLRAAGEVVVTDQVEAELVGEFDAIAPGETFWVALRLKMTDGWHTYWRNPGDSGQPTEIRWSTPPGFEVGDIVWPAPERMVLGSLAGFDGGDDDFSLANFGYHGEVLLLVPVRAPSDLTPGETVRFDADARWLVCADICIPEEGSLSLSLPVSPDPLPSRWAPSFEAARDAVPGAADWSAEFEVDGETIRLGLDGAGLVETVANGAEIHFFPYEENLIVNAADQVVRFQGDRVMIAMEADFGVEDGVTGLDGVVTITARGDSDAFEIAAAPGEVAAGGAARAAPTTLGGVAQALVFAFIGGLILNLMPCVFPVLFVKAMGFAQRAHADAVVVRRHGLVFALGVLATFAALAMALLALRAGGGQIGWGFHLQNPLVVTLLAYVLFLVGLSLSGVFEFGESVMGLGGELAAKEGDSGAFFTGVLAVVVAAPCTAPFMAAALGFALTQPAAVSVLIFLALGAGLAAPYVALSFAPGLLRVLPRPGVWMTRLKEGLAFPMYAAVVWLFWVLSKQKDPNYVAASLLGLVFIAFGVWALQASKGARRWRGPAVAAAVASFALGLASASANLGLPPFLTKALFGGAQPAELSAVEYSPARIEAFRAEGRAVFVDFTAAWCLTCQINKLTVLYRPDVVQAFVDNNAVYMVADWTNHDAEITTALSEFGAVGVPFYVVYSGTPREAPATLPTILTPGLVKNAIAAP